jgi:cell division protein FtsB
MQSITTMMQKQTAADEKLKKQLAESQKQVKELKARNQTQQQQIEDLKKQLAELESDVQEAAEETAGTATE